MTTNPRQALIMAALCGWKGDDPCGWQSPVDEGTIISWAESHCDAGLDKVNFYSELSKLVSEGLFFKIHPNTFETPVYYCSYDTIFLTEIFNQDNEPDPFELWKDCPADYDRQFSVKWRRHGVCFGGGSQSGSNPPDVCKGIKCDWYEDGKPACNWELKFKR